jgi:hypothetical protein
MALMMAAPCQPGPGARPSRDHKALGAPRLLDRAARRRRLRAHGHRRLRRARVSPPTRGRRARRVGHLLQGRGQRDGAGFRLTPHEIASALSFFLVDGPPDRGLVEAATSDALATRAGLEKEARRLLATPDGAKLAALLGAPYALADAALAAHYGAAAKPITWERLPLTDRPGGLLTQASFLTIHKGTTDLQGRLPGPARLSEAGPVGPVGAR